VSPTATKPAYDSRSAAGATLGGSLNLRIRPPVLVWGITPTGVEVAASASQAMGCPFDVVVGAHVRVEGLGIIGAVAEDAEAVVDPGFNPRFGVMETLEEAFDRARRAVKTERLLFRGQRPIREVKGVTVAIVEGHATNPWKLLAAASLAQQMGAARVVVAAAVGTQSVREQVLARRLEFACPTMVDNPNGHAQPFGDPQDPSAERLRSIVVARQAA
jgi:putative phosphoribosyl transferase